VSCTNVSCTAIGKKGGKPVAWRWNGSERSALTAPNEVSAETADLSCTADNACTAVLGNSAKVERWDGTKWTSATVPTPEGGSAVSLKGVSCATATSCIATGSYTKEGKTMTLGEYWNGSAWSVQSTPNLEGGGALAGISCIAATKCTAVGSRTIGKEIKTMAERYGVPPAVTAEAATSIKVTEATLNANINPEGNATSYYFEYGPTTSYGTKIPTTAKEAGSGTENVKVSQTPTGLESSSTYHFRVVASSSEGTFYGEDVKFTTAEAPTFSFAFGSEGTGNGQFKSPKTIAVDSSGNLWVADTENNRVQEFNSKGEYLTKFGTEGTGNGQFKSPRGIAIDSSGNLWVTDSSNSRVEKFNSKGEYLSQFGTSGSGNGQLSGPSGLAIDASGNLWVVDTNHFRVQEFNSKGEYLTKFGSAGSGNGQLSLPTGIAIDTSGNLWVVDTENRRIQEFNSKGEYLSKFGSNGSGNGQFKSPSNIAIDSSGSLWVTDTNNSRVEKFNSKGEYLTQFGAEGAGNGQFKSPKGIAIDGAGNYWVVDSGNNRVQGWR
jgi:DNA-binding beta-propeller fold protein YncE